MDSKNKQNKLKSKKPQKTVSEISLLNNAGLSIKEAEIYEILLKLGKVPLNKVLPETKLKRTTIYSILDELEKKDIIEKDDSTPITQFRAKHPFTLKSHLEEKLEEIKNTSKQLDAVLPNLISLYNTAQNLPGVKFYEGREGVWQVLKDSLTAKSIIYTFADIESIVKYIDEINKKYVALREKKQIKKQAIILDTPFAREYLAKYHKEITDMKLIKNEDAPPFQTVMQIYENKISYITLTDDFMIGVIIADKHIYQMHKYLFEHLWQTTEGIKI